MHARPLAVAGIGIAMLFLASRSPALRAGDPLSEGERIVAGHTAIFTRPPSQVPAVMMPDGPLLGNGDVGVVVGGPAEDQRFHIASYRQEEDMALGEVRGVWPASSRSTRWAMQSHEGVLRLFPAWPRDLDARFGGLRAVGAFLVSAALLRRGRGRGDVSEKGKRFTPKTTPGERLEIRTR